MTVTFDLKKAAFDNWITVFTYVKDLTYKENGTIGTVIPKIPFPLFNLVLQSEIKEFEIESEIESVKKKYKEFNLNFNWSITPFTKPNNFEKYLIDKGFQYKNAIPHMGILNSDIDESIFNEVNQSKLKIKKIDKENFEEYFSTLESGFEMGSIDRKVWYDGFNEFFGAFLDDPRGNEIGFYLGYFENKPVCTSLGIISNDVLGIYNISTIPGFRKRGFGRIMTLDLVRQGYEKANGSILQASAVGKPVYEKLGFSTLYEAKAYSLT